MANPCIEHRGLFMERAAIGPCPWCELEAKGSEIARLRDYSTGLHDFIAWLSQRHEHDGLTKGQIIRMAARMDVGGKWQDDHVKYDGRTAIEVLDAEIVTLWAQLEKLEQDVDDDACEANTKLNDHFESVKELNADIAAIKQERDEANAAKYLAGQKETAAHHALNEMRGERDALRAQLEKADALADAYIETWERPSIGAFELLKGVLVAYKEARHG